MATSAVRFPAWHLDYRVVVLGAHATSFIGYFSVVFGLWTNASPVAISIITNGMAILLAGFTPVEQSKASSVTCVGLTTLFMMYAIAAEKRNEVPFDGRYAILCAVGHLTYNLLLSHTGTANHNLSAENQCKEKKGTARPELSVGLGKEEEEETIFYRNIAFSFGDDDAFRIEGVAALLVVLGTAMTYRVFDFDLGFGLVFASISAICCCFLLYLINFARVRGRRMNIFIMMQNFAGMLVISGLFFYSVVPTIARKYDLEDDLSWWRLTFGVVWFPFLFITMFTPCRFLAHATFFPCQRCRHAAIGVRVSDDFPACPAGSWRSLPKFEGFGDLDLKVTRFWIMHERGPDKVERYWLDGRPWIQISPRAFVIAFISLWVVLFIGHTDHTNFGVTVAFYVALAFTLAAVGHSGARDLPELMFASIKDNFVSWTAALAAIATTGIAHLFLASGYMAVVIPVVVPLWSLAFTPLLLIGVSQAVTRQGENDKQGTLGDLEKGAASETAEGLTPIQGRIDDTFTYSSRFVRRLDLRVLIMGLLVSIFDYFVNEVYEYQEGHCPRPTVVCLITTTTLLLLDNPLLPSRDLDPEILYLATVSVVGIFGHFNFLQLFGLDPNVGYIEDDNLTENWTVMLAALWFALFGMMIMINRGLEMKAKLSTTSDQPAKKNALIFDIDPSKYGLPCRWQLRNAQITICMVLAFFAAYCGESFPLPFNTTICSLVVFVCVVGYQHRKLIEAEKPSWSRQLALPACAFCGALAVVVNRYDPLSAGWSDRVVGTGAILTAYSFATAVFSYVLRRQKQSEGETFGPNFPSNRATLDKINPLELGSPEREAFSSNE